MINSAGGEASLAFTAEKGVPDTRCSSSTRPFSFVRIQLVYVDTGTRETPYKDHPSARRGKEGEAPHVTAGSSSSFFSSFSFASSTHILLPCFGSPWTLTRTF